MSPFNDKSLVTKFHCLVSAHKEHQENHLDGIESFNADVVELEKKLSELKLPQLMSESVSDETSFPNTGDMVYLEYISGKIYVTYAWSKFHSNTEDLETDYPYTKRFILTQAPLPCRQYVKDHGMLGLLIDAATRHFSKHFNSKQSKWHKTESKVVTEIPESKYPGDFVSCVMFGLSELTNAGDEGQSRPVVLKVVRSYLKMKEDEFHDFLLGDINWCLECRNWTYGDDCSDECPPMTSAKQVIDDMLELCVESKSVPVE